jgi:APA family basic amino acid/polyamine antiporter
MMPPSGVPSPPRPLPSVLIRAIGRWPLTALVINSVIGSGIFGVPAAVAGLVGPWSPLAFLIAGCSVFVIVLCFAEVGSRFDDSGGPYLYAREAFGPAVAFQIGWLHLWTRILSAAAVVNVLAAYMADIVPWVSSPAGRAFAMTAGMAVATSVNVSGIRPAAWMVNTFTVAKLLPLVGVSLLGVFFFRTDVVATQAVASPDWTEAVLLLVFAYGGFESSIVAAGETRDPRRDTGFALVVAMVAITAIYCLIQLVVVGVLPNAREHAAPVTATLRELVGPPGAVIGAAAVVTSVYGWLLGFVLTTPRILFSMAVRREMPSIFARVHHAWRTPHVAIVGTAVVALALGLLGGFTQLATFSVISRLGIYGVTCAALVVLRRKHGESVGFRAPGGAVTAVAGIAFCVWLLSTRNLAQAWFLPVVLLIGAVLWLTRRTRRPDQHDEGGGDAGLHLVG